MANEGDIGGDLDQDLDFRNNPPYPPIDLPLQDFRKPADRSEKTFAQAKIDTIPQDWIDLAKQKYPDLTDQNIDLIFANMVSTYTSKTKYMGTKVRDWRTKWVEQLVIKAPDVIANTKRIKSTSHQPEITTVERGAAYQPAVIPQPQVEDVPLTPEQQAAAEAARAKVLQMLGGN